MARKETRITGNELIVEISGYTAWEIDEELSRDALKKHGYELSDSYKRWGKEHVDMIMIVLYAKLNCVEKQLRKTYLISLKCNSDVTIGRSVVANVAQMVSMVISVFAAIASITEKVKTDASFLLFAMFILLALYWFVAFISSKYSYQDVFYEKIIDELLKEISEEND